MRREPQGVGFDPEGDGATLHERYLFECPACQQAWNVDFGVRLERIDGDRGGVIRAYYRGKAPARSPWEGMDCPRCGGRAGHVIAAARDAGRGRS